MAELRKNVAVLFGGRSVEHEISVITGIEVLNAIDVSRYNPIPVYVDIRGRWFTGQELLDKSMYRNLPQALDALKEVTLLPRPGTGGLTVLPGKSKGAFGLFAGSKEEVLPIDVFMPIFHGQYGEDGCIQGLFELADVVYTGCNVLASAVAMNKYICKAVVLQHGVPVLPSIVIHKNDAQRDLSAVRKKILNTAGLSQFPLFLKPVNLGSSIGVGKAADEASLTAALAKVFEFDTECIVEPCITNMMEINVSVLENGSDAAASVVEVPVASKETLTYEDKYMRGGKGSKGSKGKGGGPQRVQGMAGLTRVIDPEDLDLTLKQKVREYALSVYRTLGCAGSGRFDFILNLDDGQVYFNELNPLPGSMAHYLWAKSSPSVLYTELLQRLIEGAIGRKELSAGLQRNLGFRALTN